MYFIFTAVFKEGEIKNEEERKYINKAMYTSTGNAEYLSFVCSILSTKTVVYIQDSGLLTPETLILKHAKETLTVTCSTHLKHVVTIILYTWQTASENYNMHIINGG